MIGNPLAERNNAYENGHAAGFDMAVKLALTAIEDEMSTGRTARNAALRSAHEKICARARGHGWEG